MCLNRNKKKKYHYIKKEKEEKSFVSTKGIFYRKKRRIVNLSIKTEEIEKEREKKKKKTRKFKGILTLKEVNLVR